MSVSERWKGTRTISLSSREAAARCKTVLEHDPRIRVAYLFGSRRRDFSADDAEPSGPERTSEDFRDIDLGIVTDGKFTSSDYYVLIERLGGVLHSDRVDLVWLNASEPIIAFEVIRDGIVLFYRDADELNEFERRAKHRYYDYKVYLRKHRAARKERDGAGGL
jgi:predicted nucleotidyltransferase